MDKPNLKINMRIVKKNNYTQSQRLSNLKKSESYYKEYNCNKSRDLTFIFKDDGAVPWKCRVVIEGKELIKNFGISESFRNMTLENFTVGTKYVN